MKRRSFLAALASLPLVGRLFANDDGWFPCTYIADSDYHFSWISNRSDSTIGNISNDGVHWFRMTDDFTPA